MSVSDLGRHFIWAVVFWLLIVVGYAALVLIGSSADGATVCTVRPGQDTYKCHEL